MSEDVLIRPFTERDWTGIEAMEFEAYAALGLSEGQAALRDRVESSPDTCFVLDAGTRLGGYLLALPYPPFQYPDLARKDVSLGPSRNLHLHDIVIARQLRRRGLGQRLLRQLVLLARSWEYERISLVAVGCSEGFWSLRGFTPYPGIVSTDSYGPNAVYMSRVVSAAWADKLEPAAAVPRGSSLRDETS